MTDVLLIRHTSVDVPKGTCYGQSDVPVAATFDVEAEAVRQRLQSEAPFDAVYRSPLTRCRLLADYCGYADAVVDHRLMEMSMGEWELQRYDEIRDERLQQWYAGYMHLPTPNGESFPALRARVARFLDELSTKGHRRVAMFTHGGVMVCAGLYAGLFTEDDAWSHLAGYGGMEHIIIPPLSEIKSMKQNRK